MSLYDIGIALAFSQLSLNSIYRQSTRKLYPNVAKV